MEFRLRILSSDTGHIPAPLLRTHHICHLAVPQSVKEIGNYFSNLVSQIGGHGVPDLVILLGAWSLKMIIVRKGLQPCSFPDGEAPALHRVIVDKIVAVF